MPRTIKAAVLAFAIIVSYGGWKGLEALLGPARSQGGLRAEERTQMNRKVIKTDKEWEETLTPEQFRVMRQCGTEPPFTGKYYDHHAEGTYVCAACRAPLFRWDSKYDHWLGMAQLHVPRRGRRRRIPGGPLVRHEEDRSPLRPPAAPTSATSSTTAPRRRANTSASIPRPWIFFPRARSGDGPDGTPAAGPAMPVPAQKASAHARHGHVRGRLLLGG